MNALARELDEVLCAGMYVPEEFLALYEWMSANGAVFEYGGRSAGTLGIPGEDAAVCGVEFRADGNAGLRYWFDSGDRAVLDRICVFGSTGGDGSMAAFWIDEEGRQRIVHMGSGSGSTVVCQLGETPVDFLRLLAIGYEELCWSEEWDAPPEDGDGAVRNTDSAFRRWVVETFDVVIPGTVDQLVTPAEMGEVDPADPFARWLLTVIA